MPGPPASIRAAVLAELDAYCRERGVDLRPIMLTCGIDLGKLKDFHALVPVDRVADAFNRVALALGDPCFGISFARHFKPGRSGILGAILITAPTVRDAMTQAAYLVAAHSPRVTASFEEKAGIGVLRWAYPPEVASARHQFVSFTTASLVLRIRQGIGMDWQPLAVEFDFCEPEDTSCYRPVFGDRLRFGADANAVTLDSTTLSRPLAGADPAVYAMAIELARRWMEADPLVPDIVRDVRQELAGRLSSGTPGLESTALSLGLSASQLQWRLEQAGTSFERVLSEMRADIARNLLSNTDKRVTDIAYALGFTDPSAFTRAARRWFDDTPLAFRRKVRGGPRQTRPGKPED